MAVLKIDDRDSWQRLGSVIQDACDSISGGLESIHKVGLQVDELSEAKGWMNSALALFNSLNNGTPDVLVRDDGTRFLKNNNGLYTMEREPEHLGMTRSHSYLFLMETGVFKHETCETPHESSE